MINMQEVLETNNMIAHEKAGCADDHDGYQPLRLCGQ